MICIFLYVFARFPFCLVRPITVLCLLAYGSSETRSVRVLQLLPFVLVADDVR